MGSITVSVVRNLCVLFCKKKSYNSFKIMSFYMHMNLNCFRAVKLQNDKKTLKLKAAIIEST